MATDTLGEALLLLSKVSSNLDKRLDKIESSVSKTVGMTKNRQIVKKAEPVIVTDFGRKAEKDLKESLSVQTQVKGDTPDKTPNFLKKLLGPGLLILGGLSALVGGILDDGKLRGLLKIISKAGIEFGVKAFSKTFDSLVKSAKGFLGNVGEFLLTPFKNIAGKGGAKGIFKVMGQLFTKTLKPLVKRIPGIGSLISWGFAYKRFKDGQPVRGLIDLASGIATLVPGIGTGIGIGLDVLNAFLDVKGSRENQLKPKGEKIDIGNFFRSIQEKIMNNFPIKNLMEFYGGVGQVIKGDFKSGFKKMAFAIPFMEGISNFLFTKIDKDETKDKISNFYSFFKGIKDKILLKVLNILPEKILGISVRNRAAKLLGVNLGEVVDIPGSEISEFTETPSPNNNTNTYNIDNEKVSVVKEDINEKQIIPSLKEETFVEISKVNLKVGEDQVNEMKKNNALLTQMLEKLNQGGNVINNNSNITNLSNNGSSIKRFRESYA